MTVLSASGLHRIYTAGTRRASAVSGVDLEVARGEWIAVMGPSGCGKSTLLHLLAGLDRPDEGAVHLDGVELGACNERRLAALRTRSVGIVFQALNLLQDLSVAENVELPMRLCRMPRTAARERRDELLDGLGLTGVASAFPHELSGGEQQRVAVARAVANRPAVLLADEPTGSLDTEAARQVMQLFRREHDQGQTMVVVTHDGRVAAAADRVLVMEDGRITAETTMRSSDTQPRLATLIPTDDW